MEQNKNNSFGWILRFAAQCRGKLAASVLLADVYKRQVFQYGHGQRNCLWPGKPCAAAGAAKETAGGNLQRFGNIRLASAEYF